MILSLFGIILSCFGIVLSLFGIILSSRFTPFYSQLLTFLRLPTFLVQVYHHAQSFGTSISLFSTIITMTFVPFV